MSLDRSMKFPFICQECNEVFHLAWKTVRDARRGYRSGGRLINTKNCSRCKRNSRMVECQRCGARFHKTAGDILRRPNHFCNHSCAASYNNRKREYRPRSRAEDFLEGILTRAGHYVECNRRDILPSGLEIDIFVPRIELAVELNGPVHYKPIYGADRLMQARRNDAIKHKEAVAAGLDFHTINVSQSRFEQTRTAISDYAKQHGWI